MDQTAQVTPAERGTQKRTPTHCPICGRALFATGLRGRDRLITGDGPFEVMECASCQFGLTDPQLSDEELARYYPPEYYDFWGYSDRPPENPLQGLLERCLDGLGERGHCVRTVARPRSKVIPAFRRIAGRRSGDLKVVLAGLRSDPGSATVTTCSCAA